MINPVKLELLATPLHQCPLPVNVELCTIPSYLNYILLYLAWLYKPARIHYILFRLRLDCPRVLDCIPGPSPGHPNARGLVLHPPAEARTPKNFLLYSL
jgi:hypothetical protein